MHTKHIGYILLIPILAFGISACSLSLQTAQDAGVFLSSDQGDTWSQRVFVATGEKKDVTIASTDILKFIFHPTDEFIIYISTPSGIYKSTNKGERWEPTQLQSGRYADFVLDPSAPTIHYAALGGKIFKSTTDGKSWEQVYNERPGVAITALAVNPSATNIIWAATSTFGILKSDDFGNTWTLVAQLNDSIKKLIIPHADPSIIYGVFSLSGFVKSTDAGKTWDQTITQSLAPYKGAIPITSFQVRLASATDILVSSPYGILRSTDGGATWDPIETVIPFNTAPINDAIMDPVDSANIYFASGNTFYRSLDGGVSWQTLKSLATTQIISHLTFNPNNFGDIFAGITKITK